MKHTFKKITCLVLVICMLLSVTLVLASCKKEGKGEYTYSTWTTAIGTNWNPHTWDTNADQSILGYLTSPFVSIEALNTEEGTYQWAYEMATSITDVTKDNQADLTKYNVELPANKEAKDVVEGYVFEIKLNPNAKWQTGEKITATDYIESMKDLLDPTMKNYRANLYYAGESAVAGGMEYYYQGSLADMDNGSIGGIAAFADLKKGTDGKYVTESGYPVWIMVGAGCEYLDGDSMVFYDEYYAEYGYDIFDDTAFAALKALMDEDGNVALTDNSWNLLCTAINTADWGNETPEDAVNYLGYQELFPEVTYEDTVGCYKVDDYTIRYVCDTAININYFLTSCTDTWLVHQETYDKLKKEDNGLVVTTYGTSLDTTVSYGVYKMSVYEDQKQVVFVQNDQWYGFTKDEDGNLYSETQFEVDGKKRQQYQTTKIVIDVMTEEVAKQKFFKGELMDYSPTAEELSSYATSERLYKVDETYTMSFFFNTGVDALKALDKSTNKNSVVLSSENFRKAMSLAIDRSDYVTVTQGWTPAFSLMNHLYHYDIYNDPTSSYRKSDAAMKAIVDLYGVEYGEGKAYATLKEAHDSINGYNLTEAKKLMKAACEELVAAGLYTAGEEIKIQIGWAKGALTSDDNAQLTKLNQYVNAALEGSGFGKITFEAIGNIEDRYGDVPAGKYAIGYGAWGGAAFYPFRNLQVYTDPDQYDINEAGCWDPTKETLTLTITTDDGKTDDYTMTWTDWGNALIGTGAFADASNEVKLQITAALEKEFLAKSSRLPMAVTTVCSILSYKVDEYTDSYNIMYGFGGFRLMSYNYDDAEWAKYVKKQGGELNYH